MDISYKISPIKRIKDIDVFEENTKYWCNVSPGVMRKVIMEITKGNDFHETVMKYLPECKDHFCCDYRADAGLLLSIDKDSIVLDAGAMWGGLTIPIACHCREIYAVDQTLETLEMLSLRAKKENISNIKLLNCSLQKLPFKDNYFDCVILNGVLEWVGMEQDVIVEEMWNNKFCNVKHLKKSPRDMQLQVLKELRRVLKNNGTLYLAIENRLALKHFTGSPDPHMNIPWVTIMPRGIANIITRIKKGIDYRTYIYSPSQLLKLLREAGFVHFSMYALSQDYRKIAQQAPIGYYKKHGTSKIPLFIGSIKRRLFNKWFPFAYNYCDSLALSCSLVPISPPRILQILNKLGIIDSANEYFAAIDNIRYENGTPVRFIIIDKATGSKCFYVKAARYNKREYCNITDEANNFHYIYSKLPQELRERLLPLCYDGEFDSYRLLITKYIHKTISPESRLRNNGIDSPLMKQQLLDFNNEAIDFLVNFQKYLTSGSMTLKEILVKFENKAETLGIKNSLSTLFNLLYTQLSDDELNFKIPMCVQHGDFDTTNILGWPHADIILDYEEINKSGTPFLDLSNLLINNFIVHHKGNKTNNIKNFQSDWIDIIKCGANAFSKKSNIPIEIVSKLHLIGCLEHQLIDYRLYRNKESFPLYGKDAIDIVMQMNIK